MRHLIGIDHTLVGVRDLEAARERWQRMGFTVTPRGRHIGWGTGNYCVMFDEGYVELLGIVNPDEFSNNLDRFLEDREGLMGLAFATDDATACVAELRAAGIAGDGPKDLKRLLELPEGTVTPEFSLVYLPADATPALSAFVCRHRMPHLVRRPAWLRHDNSARTLLGMTIATERPRDLMPAYRKLFGERSAIADATAMLVDTGMGRLVFATPDTLAARYRAVAPLPDHASPWAVAMIIGVEDLMICRRTLEAGAFAPVTLGEGLALGPDQTGGLFLEFAPV